MPSRILENVPARKAAPPATAEGSSERRMVPVAPTANAVALAPVLKLSFGGVDFSLLPKQSSDGSVTFEAMGQDQAVLSLKNFTGALRVTCTSLSHKPVARQDSVTPSPSRTQHPLPTTALARKDSTTSSQPTPLTANRNRNTQVEQVVAASRSSPLPYQSPIKRNLEESTSRPLVKRTKTTPLSQQLPPSPIATQKSPRMSLSSPDCSQTQPSGSSQVSMEDLEGLKFKPSPKTLAMQTTLTLHQEEDDDDEEEEQGNPKLGLPTQLQQEEDEEDEEDEEMEDAEKEGKKQALEKEEEDDEESVATRKGEDEDDQSLSTCGREENDNKKTKQREKVALTPLSQMSAAEETAETTAAVAKPKPALSTRTVTPANRWGHNMVMMGDDHRVLLYGGQSFVEQKNGDVLPTTLCDVHVFDMGAKKWIQHYQSEGNQHIKQWASATYLPDRQQMLVFGGEHMNPKTGRTVCSDKGNLMVLDTEILLWYPPTATGDLPAGRSGHSATLLPSSSQNEVIIWGGVKASKHLNTVSVLDTKAWRWSTPKIQGVAPKARSYHSATAIQATPCGHHSDQISNSKNAAISIRQRTIIFGGNDHKESFNTVHVLEKIEGANSTWRWFHPTVSGTPPRPRTGHSATLLADQKTICIYGGWDPVNDDEEGTSEDDTTLIFDDSFLLDTETWTWKQGPAPVFKGHSLDPAHGANGGSKRVGHCAVLNTTKDDKSTSEVLIFGGRIPGDDFTGDFQTLTISHQ